MGLLDDAIREHLDLKRSRGADPTEIERAEREALGPVRRDPTSLAPAALSGEHADDAAGERDPDQAAEPSRPQKRRGLLLRRPRGDAESAPPAIDEAAHQELDDHDEFEPEAELHLAPPPSSADGEPEAGRPHDADSGAVASPSADAAPEPPRLRIESPSGASSPPPARGTDVPPPVAAPMAPDTEADDPHGETAEYDVQESFESEPTAPDVLEETPDFLQDTPDHDRLWFEQRPPRDFDFDG